MRIKRKKRVMMKIAQNRSADYPRGKVQRLLKKVKSVLPADATNTEEASATTENKMETRANHAAARATNNSENNQLSDTKEPTKEPLGNNEENCDAEKEPLDVEKSRVKICRLCLVFIDDNFISLEKIVAMLQIVLPEVVSFNQSLYSLDYLYFDFRIPK